MVCNALQGWRLSLLPKKRTTWYYQNKETTCKKKSFSNEYDLNIDYSILQDDIYVNIDSEIYP
jgi:hypothetical protein